VTFVGYMTNNCVLSSAAAAADQGLGVEVLSDATGAINIADDAGYADAGTVHTTLMALLHSNFAAVGSTATWVEALQDGTALPKSNLVASATTGLQRATHT
jgi:nicotinamidase-related amidase